MVLAAPPYSCTRERALKPAGVTSMIAPSRRPLHDHVAPALGRPPLGPVDIVAIERDLIEPQRAGRDARWR